MNTSAIEHYLDQFNRAKPWLPGSAHQWALNMRENAWELFNSEGFPTIREENWKYTDLRSLAKSNFILSERGMNGIDEQTVSSWKFTNVPCHTMVFVNGHYSSQLSHEDRLPSGITISSLSQALTQNPEMVESVLQQTTTQKVSPLTALNMALMTDGAVIILDDDTTSQPIHLLYITTSHKENISTQIRNLIIGGRGSSATIVESYVSKEGATSFTNVVSDVMIHESAKVEHYKVQQESLNSYHIGAINVRQYRDSRYISNSISLGAGLARTDIHSMLNEEGASCCLNGLYIVGGKQHVDHHTRIDHNVPSGKSEEFYKGVINGRARAVFNGKVVVHEKAQKTDAQQSNRNLLLSKEAEVDTKPELEIYADDVKCSHGATVGQLEEDTLFYLQSRGIEEENARKILIYAFIDDIISRITIKELRTRLETFVIKRLPGSINIEELV
jgi:Fe-S cluster assembly protein SufD